MNKNQMLSNHASESEALERVADLRREVTTLPLAAHVRHALMESGFWTVSDLAGMTPASLSARTGMNQEEAMGVLQQGGTGTSGVHSPVWKLGKTADEILKSERKRRRIITFCPDLDRMLGGGVGPCEITEFCGVPGIGKTQLGIQLVVDVQIPKEFGGIDGHAVYIDTEGSFMAERAEEIAHACLEHLQKVATSSQDADLIRLAGRMSVDEVLGNIHLFRVHSSTEQIALVQILPEFLQAHPRVKVVVIDSIAFHFRQDFKDMANRTRILSSMMQGLMNTANDMEVAIAMMNQVTTKINTDGEARLVPALGDTFAHAATNRIILFWQDGKRYAHLYKSPYLPSRTVPYELTSQGIRGSGMRS